MAKDLTGMKVGRLTVVGRGEDYVNPNNGRRHARWECVCECGGRALVQTGNLTTGRAQSCGCIARENASNRCKALAGKIVDISGQKFGRLTAMEPVRVEVGKQTLWRCQCECGNEATVRVSALLRGTTRSCGCLKQEVIAAGAFKSHGESHTRLYNVWNGMRQRCHDPNHKSYGNYGGRGITVCEEWNDYEVFKEWALASGYSEDAEYGECTLDRENVNGNYEPSNCRWTTLAEQARNRRNSKK